MISGIDWVIQKFLFCSSFIKNRCYDKKLIIIALTAATVAVIVVVVLKLMGQSSAVTMAGGVAGGIAGAIARTSVKKKDN